MSYTQWDKGFFEGWRAGYEKALDDIREELLEYQRKEQPLPIEVFEILDYWGRKIKGEDHGKATNLPACENEQDLIFNNID